MLLLLLRLLLRLLVVPKVLVAVLLQVVQDRHELLGFFVDRVLDSLVEDGHVVGDVVDGDEVHVVGFRELDGGGGRHRLLQGRRVSKK